VKVAIIGGGGRVGSCAAFALQCAGLVAELQILDANQAIARRPASYELYRDLAAFEFRNGDWRQGWADYLMSVRLAWSRHSSSQSATGYWRYYT